MSTGPTAEDRDDEVPDPDADPGQMHPRDAREGSSDGVAEDTGDADPDADPGQMPDR